MRLPDLRRLKPEILLPGCLLGINLLLRLAIALRPLADIDGLLIPDDAYLSLTLARNIARGLGPLYGAEFTNGFQPLYVFLAAPLYWIWPADANAPVHGALVLLGLFDTLTLYLLYRWLRLVTRGLLGPLAAMTAWVFSPYVLLTTLNGLETIVASCAILGVLYHFQRCLWPEARPRRRRALFVLGLLLGLAIFARVDNTILAFTLALILADGWPRTLAGTARGMGEIALVGAGALLALAPWLLYSYLYTGDFYPVSGKAARFMSLANVGHDPTLATWYGPMMKKGWEVVWDTNQVIIWFCLGLMVFIFAVRRGAAPAELRRQLRPLTPVAIFAVILFFAYTLYIFTDWYFYRYLFPVALPFLLALGLLAGLAAEALARPWARRVLAGVLLAGIASAQMAQPEFRTLLTGSGGRELGYMNVALWAREHFKPGTAIGSSQTGALGYFAENMRVVNLDGVVNKACFRSLVEGRNMEYIRACGIEYILGWECNISFLRMHSVESSVRDLSYVNDVDGLKSWGFKWGLYKVNALKAVTGTGRPTAGK